MRRKLAPRQQVTQVEDPEFGTLLELPAIDIEGDPDANVLPYSEEEARDIPMRGHNPNRRRRPVTELEPIDIQGSRSADVEPFDMDALPKFSDEPAFVPGAQEPARRADGVSTMLPDWVPPWATEVIGQPVRGMGGTTDYEVPEWLGELVADSEGQMPTSVSGGAWELSQNLVPGVAQGRQFAGVDPSREARTISPMSALAGLADAGSMGASDDIVGLFDEDAGDAYRREMQTTQRQNPGSFALGEAGGMAAQMLVPGAAQGRGATTAARAGYAALEGATYGGIEGMARSNAPTFMGRVEDAAIGAGAGGLLGGAFGAASGRFDSAATDAQRRLTNPTPSEQYAAEGDASRAAWHQIGQFGADQSQARQRMAVGGRGQALPESQLDQMAVRTAQQMRDRGIIAQEGSYLPIPREESQTRARVMQEQARDELAAIIRSVENERVDVSGLADSLATRAQDFETTPGFGSVGSRVREFERDVRGATSPTVRDLQRWKTLLGQREHFPLEQQSTRAGAYTDARDALQSEIERLLPGQADAYRDARQRAALGFQLADVTAGDARREGRNRTMGITSYLAGGGMGGAAAMAAQAAELGGTGTTMAALGGMALAGAANSAFRSVEHGVTAGRLERAAMALRTNPARFGAWASRLQAAQKRGAQAFASALYIAQQNDAAVREAVATEEDVQQMRDAGTAEQRTREEIQDYFSDTPQMTHPVAPSTEEERAAFFR